MNRRCPVCQARFRGSPLCSRCGADLEPMMRLAAAAYVCRRSAREALRDGDYERAGKLAAEAQALEGTPAGAALAQTCGLLAQIVVAS